jgi:hypothetical protein
MLRHARLTMRKARAKQIILLRTKIYLSRKVRRFALCSMDDRFTRYGKDALTFATVMYFDKFQEKMHNVLMVRYFTHMKDVARFRLALFTFYEKIASI